LKALSVISALFVSPLVFAAGASIEGLLSLVIYLVVIGLIFWCIWWALSQFVIPEPFNKVIRVVLGLVALIIVINLLLGLLGTPLFNLR
jgi:hypothetical protein